MSDNTMDGGQSVGTGGTPTPPASTGTTPASSPGGVTLEAALRDMAELKAQVRSLQSEKDKGVAKVAKEVKSLSEQFARYEQLKARGYAPDEIERQFELDALLAERRQAAAPQVPQTPSAGTPAVVASPSPDDAILKSFNIEPGSAEATTIMRQHPDDVAARVLAYVELQKRTAQAQTRPANPAQVMSGGGGTSVPDDVEALTEQLGKLSANPSKNMAEIKKVSARLEQLVKTK